MTRSPLHDLGRLGDALVADMSWSNLQRAVEDPLRLPAGLTWDQLLDPIRD